MIIQEGMVVLKKDSQEKEATNYLVPVQKGGFLFEIKACEKFYHRHILDIPRIKF